MRDITYGRKITRKMVIHDLVFLCFFHFWIANITYLFPSVLFNIPVYCYPLYLLIYFIVMLYIVQSRACRTVITFNETGIRIQEYPKLIYVWILRNRPPEEAVFLYDDIRLCRLSYQRADRCSTQRFHLCISLQNQRNEKDIIINTVALSNRSLHMILLLLSTKAEQFEDKDQLHLCLMQERISFDTYVTRLEGKKHEDHS